MFRLIKHFFKKCKFLAIVIFRAIVILFRKRKKIELLHLDYCKEHLFDNSYVVFRYRFRNAISYSFGNHNTLEKNLKIFDLKNFEGEIDFVVYGFFQKQVHKLSFKPTLSLSTVYFKVEIKSLRNELKLKPIPNLISPDFITEIAKPQFNVQKVKVNLPIIKIKPTIYNQTEFI